MFKTFAGSIAPKKPKHVFEQFSDHEWRDRLGNYSTCMGKLNHVYEYRGRTFFLDDNANADLLYRTRIAYMESSDRKNFEPDFDSILKLHPKGARELFKVTYKGVTTLEEKPVVIPEGIDLADFRLNRQVQYARPEVYMGSYTEFWKGDCKRYCFNLFAESWECSENGFILWKNYVIYWMNETKGTLTAWVTFADFYRTLSKTEQNEFIVK
jgi:hypothetical protein